MLQRLLLVALVAIGFSSHAAGQPYRPGFAPGFKSGFSFLSTTPVGPITDPAITAINANGWTVADGAASVLRPVNRNVVLDRKGFDGLGQTTVYRETMLLTQRVRQPYNSAYSTSPTAYLNASNPPLDASATALADYAYDASTDTVVGGSAVNNSTEASPQPIVAWAQVDHRVLVGNSFPADWAELVGFHRNARNREQVAAVVWTWSDGVNPPVTRTVSASVISGSVLDRNPVIVYRPPANVDLSSLANGTITLNAKVYPWIGTSASIADSSTGALGSNAFSPQVFVKQSAPIRYAYVATTGTCLTSTIAAEAALTPCTSIAAATNALIAANGNTSGTEIRLTEGTWATATPNANTQGLGEAVITAAPGAAKANTIIQVAAAWTTNHTYLRIKGITLQRTAAVFIRLGATATATKLVLEDVALDTASGNAALTNAAPVYLHGVTVSAPVVSLFNPTTSMEVRMLRGVDYGTLNAGTSSVNVEGRLILGSVLRGVNVTTLLTAGRHRSGTILAYSKLLGLGSSNPVLTFGASGAPDVVGAAIVQNVFEWTYATTANASFRPSGDADPSNTTHVVVHLNTFAGYGDYGRSNILYDEGATARAHRLPSFIGNIQLQANTKQDVFAGISGSTQAIKDDAPNRKGGWPYMYGVGARDEIILYRDANSTQSGVGGHFSQAFPGLNALTGTSSTALTVDPKFTLFRAATWSGTGTTATAGAGGGDYSLQAGSAAIGRGANPVLRFYLDGGTRPPANDNIGAMGMTGS